MNIGAIIERLARRGVPAGEPHRAAGTDDLQQRAEGENPYLAARRTWNDQSAANAASRQMFQLLGVLALLVALAGVGGMVYIGSQSRFVPYVVEVDRLGQRQAVARADRAAPVDQRVLHASVADWIGSMRMVTPDIALQRKAVFKVYAMLAPNDPATAKANEWLNGTEESNPFKRAARETASIEIASVIPQTPDTWPTSLPAPGTLPSPRETTCVSLWPNALPIPLAER